MRLEVVRQVDAQQLGGSGALLATGAARGEPRGDNGGERNGRRHADAELKEEVARPHDVERDPRRDAELVEVVDVQEGVRDPPDEHPVQDLVGKGHEHVVEHDRPEDGEGADAGDADGLAGAAPLARGLLASAQSCTPIPRRS